MRLSFPTRAVFTRDTVHLRNATGSIILDPATLIRLGVDLEAADPFDIPETQEMGEAA